MWWFYIYETDSGVVWVYGCAHLILCKSKQISIFQKLWNCSFNIYSGCTWAATCGLWPSGSHPVTELSSCCGHWWKANYSTGISTLHSTWFIFVFARLESRCVDSHHLDLKFIIIAIKKMFFASFFLEQSLLLLVIIILPCQSNIVLDVNIWRVGDKGLSPLLQEIGAESSSWILQSLQAQHGKIIKLSFEGD